MGLRWVLGLALGSRVLVVPTTVEGVDSWNALGMAPPELVLVLVLSGA